MYFNQYQNKIIYGYCMYRSIAYVLWIAFIIIYIKPKIACFVIYGLMELHLEGNASRMQPLE